MALVAVCIPLILSPETGNQAVTRTYAAVTTYGGFLYTWASLACLVFVMWLALSRSGALVLGPPDEPPRFSNFSWTAMMFCAGVATGILYWGTIEWAYYLKSPPFGVEPGSTEAIEWATSYGIFHWGPNGWAFVKGEGKTGLEALKTAALLVSLPLLAVYLLLAMSIVRRFGGRRP